jgi:hypothetical protein
MAAHFSISAGTYQIPAGSTLACATASRLEVEAAGIWFILDYRELGFTSYSLLKIALVAFLPL